MNVVVDIETRSKADLPSVGSYRYAVDESTEILMIGVSTTEANAPVYLHVPPQFETPDMLSDPEALELLRKADLVYCHNVYFEHALYWAKGFGGVRITVDQWRCTAAMARKAGLPAKLEDLAKALGLPQQKDPRGKTLIKKFSIPQADGTFVDPKSAPEDWLAFGEYCKRDVIAEKQAHRRLAAFELTGESLATFQFDLRMNLRGIPVNVTALRAAQKAIREVESRVTKEFQELTGLNPTQRNRVLELLQGLGVQINDMQADTLATVQIASEKGREVIRLYSLLSYAAVKKVDTMLDWVCPKTGRMRGVMKYYGAGTGRWSNSGPTIQNAKKATKEMRAITKEAYAYLCRGGTAEGIDLVYGGVFEVIASSIRHFVHVPGKEMLDGDYNAIEARIICWLAGQDDILQMWRTGQDLYKVMASKVYGVPVSLINSDQRDHGKRIELGCFEGDTPIVTKRGLVPIRYVTSRDRVWDGVDWVKTDGCVFQGCKKTLDLMGVRITPDHLIFSGKTWETAEYLAQNEGSRYLALATASESFESLGTPLGSEVGYSTFWSNALVVLQSIRSWLPTCTKGELLGVLDALGSKRDSGKRDTVDMLTWPQMTALEKGFLIVYPVAFLDATVLQMHSTQVMEDEEYAYSRNGEKTDESICDIYSRYLGTINQNWRLIGSMLMGDMNRGTLDSLLEKRTLKTNGRFRFSKLGFWSWKRKFDTGKSSPVFDLLNCGPRNRFTIWTDRGPLIAHNCGYQMGPAKFLATCEAWGAACDVSLAERSVEAYRSSHPKVVQYWYRLDEQARNAIETPGTTFGPFVVKTLGGIPFLLSRLPSGRQIAYPHPRIEVPDGMDRSQVTYWGQVKGVNWGRVKLYGGKLAENITQGTAADIMAHGAIVAEQRGMPPFALIHDQGLALQENGHTADEFAVALADLPAWAKGLPIRVAAHQCDFYSK